jgi:hypothetical protein
MEIVKRLFAGRANRRVFAYPRPELTVIPRHTKVIVASITIQDMPAGVCQEDCWSWRLPHAGDLASDYPGILLIFALMPGSFF